MTLNKRTTSTILAALRAYQRLLAVPVSDPQLVEAMGLASGDGGTLTELSVAEIDAVCEDLNFDGARPRIRRAKHRRTADERCNSLSHAYGRRIFVTAKRRGRWRGTGHFCGRWMVRSGTRKTFVRGNHDGAGTGVVHRP